MPREALYMTHADWWPLLSSPDDYVEEAAIFHRTLQQFATRPLTSLLELGCGGGNNASHLKAHYALTLTDCSPAMLTVCRALNPECECLEGDMRTLRLERQFDAVFIHDAIAYMTSREDLDAAISTAATHCRDGGVVLLVPDYLRETFCPSSGHGGNDSPHDRGRAMRYLQWTWDPDPSDSSYLVDFAIMLRHADGHVDTHYERHTCGLFDRGTWTDACDVAGLDAYLVPFEHSEVEDGVCEMVVGVKRASLPQT